MLAGQMEIRILGPLEALDGGEALGLGGRKQRALLAALALSPGRAVAVSRLVEDLWGEEAPDTAPKMVQIHVSQLRKALPAGALVTQAPGYRLDVGPREVDAFRAQELLRRGREALAAGDAEGAEAALAEGLGLWRGPALAEFAEPFAAGEARRLEELQLSLLEERIEAGLALGRHAELIGEIEALIARQPLRERPRGQLMLALYRGDRQAEALAAYQDARRALADELGIDPSAALRELERRILQQDPALVAAPPAPRPAPPPAPSPAPAPAAGPAIVGREAELAALEEHMAAAAGGEPRAVVVAGEAGAGKTTLVEAFLARAGRGEVLVGRGQCVEQHGASEAYMPVLGALDRLCRAVGAEGVVPVLVERAPTWIVQMPWLVSPAQLAQVQGRVLGATPDRMLREIVEALTAAAAERPVALVLEDLHWSDPSTVTLLEALARRREPARLLVIGTLRSADAATRSHPVHAALGELAPRGLVARIDLGALGEDAVDDYLRARVPGAALPEALGRALLERTGGNPLFLEKAIDSWVDEGKVVRAGAGWSVGGDPEELARGVPSSVRQLLRQRLLSVDPADRQILEAASVVAPEFSAAVVASALERPSDEVEARCADMARDGIMLAARGAESWPDGTIAGRFGFAHDLCHEVLYEDLPAGRRARLHVAAGARLEAAYGDRAAEIAPALAAHFVRGGDAPRALRHLQAAAAQALERLAPREATELLDTGLELLGDLPAGRDRTERELILRNMLGPALIATQGWASAAAEAAFLRAGDLARELGLPEEASWSKYKLATLYEVQGQYERSEALLEEVLAEPDQRRGAPGLVDSHELLACSLYHQGAFDRALESAERGLAAYDEAATNAFAAAYGENPGIACHSWAALSLWHLGHPDRARARAASSVALAEDPARRHGLPTALVQAAAVGQWRRDLDETRELAEAGIAAARRKGFDYRVGMGMILRGWAVAAAGAAEEGIAELRRGIVLSRATGARMDDAYFLGLLADALTASGAPGEALEVLEEALGAVPRGGRFFHDAELHRLRAEAQRALGDDEEAEGALRRALEVARGQGGRSLELRAALSLGRLLRENGRPKEAQALVAGAYGGFTEGFDTPDLREAAEFLAGGDADAGRPTPGEGLPDVRYATADGLSIAYEVTGDGPVDLVLVPGFLSHLEMDRREPGHARFLDGLAGMARLIRFDKRGTGMSDRPAGVPSLEARMDDVRAVMEAAGSERAVLFGYSEGGPMSLLFAATYPERVRGLVLFGSFAKRIDPDEDYPWAPTREERARHLEQVSGDWRFEAQMRTMCPSADEAMARWWGERCRAAASPGAVRSLMEMNSRIDVRDVLPAIRVPTLVVHRGADSRVLVEESRYLADRIPGARLLELPGADHFVALDPDQILEAVAPFVAELAAAPGGPGPERALATAVVAEGPGAAPLALFDGPARAIRAALAAVRAAGSARVGVHTGEVERRDGRPSGPAVEVAAAVAAAADAGEVLVTATTRDLVPGAGLSFEDRGERRLGPGVARRLYAVRDGGEDAGAPALTASRSAG
jgi:DNA-binding SARP family transcriptional activator/pimeloyl-ACP methyl ester carboxylesterase/predicted ATPase/type II secretory pathway predicted ATPase ExeA